MPAASGDHSPTWSPSMVPCLAFPSAPPTPPSFSACASPDPEGLFDFLDSLQVTAAFEGSGKPELHDFQSGFQGHHPLPEAEDVRVVMLAGEPGAFEVPADSAADAFDFVGNHRFAIAGAAQDNAALTFSPCDSFRSRADE